MKHKFMCNINIIFIKKTKILCLNLNKYKIERFFFNFYNFFLDILKNLILIIIELKNFFFVLNRLLKSLGYEKKHD